VLEAGVGISGGLENVQSIQAAVMLESGSSLTVKKLDENISAQNETRSEESVAVTPSGLTGSQDQTAVVLPSEIKPPTEAQETDASKSVDESQELDEPKGLDEESPDASQATSETAQQQQKSDDSKSDFLDHALQWEGMAHSTLMAIENWLIVVCLGILVLLIGGIYLCIVWIAKRRMEEERTNPETSFPQSTVHPLVGGKSENQSVEGESESNE